MRTLLAAIIAISLVACDDDSSGKSNDYAENNSENSENNDYNPGTWSMTLDGEVITGTATAPYYDKQKDELSITMVGGPDEFTNLVLEIVGQNYGATGKFNKLSDLKVIGGGLEYSCFLGTTNPGFEITIVHINAKSVEGSFAGTLNCSGRDDIQVTGTFKR